MYPYPVRPTPQVFSWCRAFLFFALFGLMATSVGCSSEPDASACDGVWCESGVCDPATQACVNPTTCTDGDECLPGFSCESSRCVADFACDTDNTCARGECVNGACMNASECSVEANCVPGYYCGEGGTCQVNNCEDTTCDRGQCIPATGQCENAATCTRATEKVDCLEGNYCMGQICVSAEAVCAELGCENGRGVCDPAARACVDAENCAGDDQNCVAGSFCNASNKCQVNKCEPDTGQCDRGVCEPGTGSCINAPSCSDQDACVDGYFCIDGTCEAQATACAECTGNQVCTQNNTTLSAECAESPLGCFNGLGCLDDRVCVDGSCVDSPACEADSFEPNNSSEEATSLNGEQQNGAIQASLCNGDVDVYTFDTRGLGLTRGTLLTELRVQGQDLGNANFKVVVRNSAGEVRAEGVGTGRSVISLEVPVNAAQQGLYTIEITDLGGSKTAGLRYSLFADFISTNITNACGNDNVKELNPGLINANSLNGATYELGSTCTSATNTAREDIYQITLTERSYVNFIARPAADVEITMSLRQSCSSMLSEFQCANLGGRGQPERLAMTLDPGTYFLIVKGPRASTGGAYSLEYIRETSVCQPGVPYCTNEQTSAVCNDRGTAHTQVLCSNGCVEDGGYCDGEPGDTCFVAIDATGGFTGTIDWSKLNNDYNLGDDADKCLPVNDQGATIGTVEEGRVGGPDQVYVVNVGAGESLQVDLTTTGLDHGSVYIVNDCQDQANTCQAGAFTSVATRQGFRKTLVWQNGSTQSERIYVVADGGKQIGGPATITIAHGPIVCTPNSTQCTGDTLEICNISGTTYQTSRECSFGCGITAGRAACNIGENNVCKGAFDILARGGTYEGFIDDYTNSYDPRSEGCTGQNGAAGPDATFFVDAEKDEVITAVMTADFAGALWVTTDCSNAARSCVDGSRTGELATEVLHFKAPEKGRYYIIADSANSSQFGKFRLDVNVELPMCPPGNVLGCADDGKTLMYCGELGAPMPHLCNTTCSGMACDAPNGDVCADAIPVKNGDMVVGSFSGRNAVNPGVGQVGQCFFESGSDFNRQDQGPNGLDTIYSVDMKAGQVLHVTGVLQSIYDRVVVYILEDCNDAANSCMASTQMNAHPDLLYTASEDKTIFVVADRLNPNSDVDGYTLKFNVFTPECEPGERTCSDAATQKTCNSLGFYEDFACPNGCQGGQCANPTGDVCADAIVLKHLDVVEGSFTGSNAISPGIKAGQCTFGATVRDGGPGADTIYAVEVRAGERLVADLDTNIQSVMYLLKECGRAESCVDNTSYVTNTKEYRLEYFAEQDELLYLVVDLNGYSATSTQTFKLSIDIQVAECTPGEVVCLEDRKTLGTCGDDGFYTNYVCGTNGCRNDRCDTPRGGICLDQVKLTSGQRVEGDFNNPIQPAIDDASFGTCDTELKAAQVSGAETYYSIDMREGELLTARLQSGSAAFMYVTEDCSAGPSSCLESSPVQAQHSEFMYVADRDKTITLVVRGTSASRSTGKFTLEVFLQQPGCFEGEVTCLDDGKSLGVCSPEGHYNAYICEGGCSNGACKTPKADFCQDAIELTEGIAFTGGHWTGWPTLDPGPGVSGACDFGTAGAPGREQVFVVDIPAGYFMRAKVKPSFATALPTMRLYAMDDCSAADTCLGLAPAGSDELVLYSEYGGPVYLVVDRSAVPVTTWTYELTVNFELPCTEGDVQCSADGTQVQICNNEGYGEVFACTSNSCTDGACDEPSGFTCQDAIPVQSGQIVTGDFSATRGNSINPGKQAVGACNFGTNDGSGMDTVYAVEMLEGQVLKAELRTATSYQMLYILDDCYNANSCLANSIQTSSSAPMDPLHYVADRDKTVFVVVDRSSSASSNTYELEFTVRAPECTPGELACQGDHMGVCSDYNLWEIYECAEGCDATKTACNEPRGNACFDAIPLLPNSGKVSGAWDAATRVSAFNPPTGAVGSCAMGSAAHVGVDTVYAIPVTVGETLRVDLHMNSSMSSSAAGNARMYILESCEQASSCKAIAGTVTNYQTTLFYNPTANGTVFLVVDYASATVTTGSYELNVTSNPPCSGNTQRCSADGTMVEICNTTNSTYDSFACASDMCTDGACAIPTGRFCQDAVVLESGDTVTGDFSGFSTLNPTSNGQCTFGTGTAGPRGAETIYAVHMHQGEVLSAVASSQGDSTGLLLYVLEDCMNAQSCLANVPYPISKGLTSTLNYQATKDGVIFLVMDWRHLSVQDFTLSINIDEPGQCTPGAIQCIDGNNLGICNHYGTLDPFACEGGCADGRCGEPQGNVCFDAIPIASGFHMEDVYAGTTSEMNPGTDSCFLAASIVLNGAERIFAIELEEGDLLKARLAGNNVTNRTAMYVLDNCELPAHDACLQGVMRSETFEFYAPRTQTYYLVVDSDTAQNNIQFWADVEKAAAVCQPGASVCDEVDGVVSICNADGTGVVKDVQCAFGCNHGACAGPPVANDVCATAMEITGDTRIIDSWGRFAANYNMNGQGCGNGTGRDAVYKVTLAPDQMIRASAESLHTSYQAVVYLVEGCPGASASCLARDTSLSSRRKATVEYLSPNGGEYYLVVDTSGTVAAAITPFVLDVEFMMTECIPGAQLCSADGYNVDVCSPAGRWETKPCAYGCGNDACLPVTNHTCGDAFNATDGLDIRITMGQYTNNYDAADGLAVSCTGDDTNGPEAVFYVDVEKNDVITAQLTAPTIIEADGTRIHSDVTPAVWITKGCSDDPVELANSCVAGRWVNYNSSVQTTYRAPEAGRYFIFADSYYSTTGNDKSPTGLMDVVINVEPAVCDAFEVTCLDANTVAYCVANGSGFAEYTCNDGCNNGICGTPRGGLCTDAILATAGGTFTGNFSDVPNTSDPGFGSCTGFEAPGPDAFYAVEMTAGQTLTATLSNGAGVENDLSLYVVTDCTDSRNTCEAGSDKYGVGAESITYTATQSGVVYVVADAWNANASGEFKLVINVQ